MHWIEQLFGADPDNGSGTVELAILLASLLVGSASLRAARRRLRRRPERRER